jgi:DNA polymerase III sliding clamp (beta) subunit (PCNA family)
LKNNLLELSASSSEEGEGNEEMEVGYLTSSTDPVVIGFNGDYLRSCLGVSEMIQNELNAARQIPVKLSNMYFKDANAQVVFIPEGLNGTTLQVVIMPLRV